MVLVTGNDVKTVKLAAKQTVHLKIIIFYLNLKQENQTKILASLKHPPARNRWSNMALPFQAFQGHCKKQMTETVAQIGTEQNL